MIYDKIRTKVLLRLEIIMNKVKIVHCSDFHFDTPFREVGEKQSKINKEEIKQVFKDIVEFCIKNTVDILLISGDVFDNYTVNRETIYFIENTLETLTYTKVFVSPGNHDPYANSSFYKLVNWPDNVHIFTGELEKIELEELNTCVYGAAFTSTYERESLLKPIEVDTNKINLLVMHGEITQGVTDNEYNPIKLQDIEYSNMDYIALGHRHEFSRINRRGKTCYAYSGCPQGRGFDEQGDKGIIYGYVFNGGTDLEFIKTSIRNYIELKVDISGVKTYQDIEDAIYNIVLEESRTRDFYKIILVGEVISDFDIDVDVIKEKIKDKFYFCNIIDKTTVQYDIEEIQKGYSIKSIYTKKILQKLDECKDDYERELLSQALKLGISSLSDGKVNIDDYQKNKNRSICRN